MARSNKTTMAKLNRERQTAEKRRAKQMRAEARRSEAAATSRPGSGPPVGDPLPPLLSDEELAQLNRDIAKLR